MRNYVLTCCSTADLSRERFESREIPYVCFHYHMDGVEYPDDLGESMSFEDFYRRMAEGAMPTTSQVNVEQFKNFFEPFLIKELDILHVTTSSALSGAGNSAMVARAELLEKYPKRRIEIINSRGASSGYGLLMDLAADLRDMGVTYDEVRQWIKDNRLRIHHWFFSTDLTSYYRGGRISKTSCLVGSALNICPLLNMDEEGRLTPRAKYRGKRRVIREIVKRMEEHAADGLDYSGKCFISHSACYEDAREVADLVEAAFPKLAEPVLINSVGTVIGSHTGPGTVALFFAGDRRE